MLSFLGLFKARKFIVPLIAVVAIGGLILAGKSYIENKDLYINELQSTISSKNIEINQLAQNISVLNGQVISLKDEIRDKEYQRSLIKDQVKNLAAKNNKIQEELREKEKKLVGRNFKKLKSSRHRELVLKIINKSIPKQFKVFEEEQPK